VTDQKPDREALDTAQGLTAALRGVGSELERLNAFGRRNRHLIWGTIVSLVIDVALTVVVAVFAVQAHEASVTVGELHATQIAACRIGNQSRAAQVALWEHVASVSTPPPHATRSEIAKRKRTLAAFLAYVAKVFAPKNCQEIYRLP